MLDRPSNAATAALLLRVSMGVMFLAHGLLLKVMTFGPAGTAGFFQSIGYPAALPHVLTVAATGRSGGVAAFSSRSPYVDIAAPGDDIVVASAVGKDWRPSSGTSFSSPIVAGAAAWLWTVRPELGAGQVVEILRRSARDIDQPGRDPASGFGMLDVRAALALPSPVKDPFEPNDDVEEVDPNGDRNLAKAPPLTTRTKQSARIGGRVDAFEDPLDVYRVWLPAGRRVTFQLTGSADADLALHRAKVRTVSGRFSSTGRLGQATGQGTTDRLVFTNPGAGRWAYISVRLPARTPDATYQLRASAAKAR